MTALRISTTFPTADLAGDVGFLTAVLGVGPTVVDGQRWAQFDLGGSRTALAGTDREGDSPSLTVKVDDLDETVARLRTAGYAVTVPVTGPHERRAAVSRERDANWSVVIYESAG
ncbi:bleomycin resistance protein [Streptomyces sp. NPDC005373]|uniref:VOC family protein n=1 Tax=Streptomyces sp. NPDC005373 TaxID=3156879 RepID=UPI0033A58176